jgi:hypothetical protein
MATKIQHCIRTLRLKVKAEGHAWLNAAVSGNESSFSAAPPSQTSSRCEAGKSAMKAAA